MSRSGTRRLARISGSDDVTARVLPLTFEPAPGSKSDEEAFRIDDITLTMVDGPPFIAPSHVRREGKGHQPRTETTQIVGIAGHSLDRALVRR